MLRIPGDENKEYLLSISSAAFPRPFRGGLEFNPPVHETWNIVHIGMMIPQSHQIYICAENCMRGVVLTAAEMGAQDRFSSVVLTEKDFYDGRLEEITLEGVTDVIGKLPYRPRAVLVFPVCVHHFVGTDMRYVYHELERRFPDIDFMRCWMDPIMQKQGLTPDQKERYAHYEKIPKQPVQPELVIDMGSNLPLREQSDLSILLKQSGYVLGQIQTCESYDDYLKLGAASTVIDRVPAHAGSVSALAKRLGAAFLYLPPEVSYEKIRRQILQISPVKDEVFEREELQCEEALSSLHQLIGDTRIDLDSVALIRPLGFARLLLAHGFRVHCIWLDVILPEEEEDFCWLQAHEPQLLLGCPTHVRMRTEGGSRSEPRTEKVLAVGPKAAWASGTTHFVNILEQDGEWGYSGIRHLIDLMKDAFLYEKDTRSIVPRKGLGCSCMLM